MELSTWLLTILTATICLYYFIPSNLSYFERRKVLHVRPILLLGNMALVVFQRITHMEYLQKLYNLFSDAKYFGFYDFSTPTFIIRDPDLISAIAIKQFDNFCDHNIFLNETLDPIASRNLLGMKNDHWREMRKLLSPIFTPSKIKIMFGRVAQCAENFVNFVAAQSGKSDKTYNMEDVLRRYATDAITTCAFSISVDSFKHPNNEFYVLAQKTTLKGWMTFKILMQRSFPRVAKLFRLKVVAQKMENFFKDVVSSTVKAADQQGIVCHDMIQLMMEIRNKNSGPTFDIDQITTQAFSFFVGGSFSASRAMCFMVHEIGVHPNIQSKLREEIFDVIRKSNGKPTYEAINDMKYLDAVVSEALRLHPVATFLDRKCVKATELPPATSDGKPVTLKPGDTVWFPTFSLHRDPKYYPQPDKFDPERFVNGDVDYSVYMPMGIGPRMCIGNRFALMEAKVILFYLLWRCDLEPDVKTRIPMMYSKKTPVLLSDNGFWMKLRTRESKTPVAQYLSNGVGVGEGH